MKDTVFCPSMAECGAGKNILLPAVRTFHAMSVIRVGRNLRCWQNNYSLLVRVETEMSTMAETCSRQQANVGFLAYSPLAGG